MSNNLQQVKTLYREDPRTQQLNQALSADTPARVELHGIVGAVDAFVIMGAFLNAPRHFLVLAEDKEQAAYLQNTLTELFDGKQIRFFPDSFKRPQYFEVLDNTNVLQRTEVINRITHSKAKGEIIVTYPEALFEQVVAPEVLEEKRLEIAVDESVDVASIIDVLTEYGFNREEFVYEPGQFSIRGGIIDIFSFGNEYPYRLELFDEEVESIRVFNPTTQLSLQNLSELSIVPNINTRFERSQKVSLFRVLPPETVIWIKSFQQTIEKLQQCFEKAEEFAKTVTILDEGDLAEIFRDRAFIRPPEVVEDIVTQPLVFFGRRAEQFGEATHRVDYQVSPQPPFNKNFPMLIEDLKSNENQLIENYIFTGNAKQIERFYNIFDDLDAKVKFHPIVTAIHEGFVDKDLKIACYTDHQIFQRFHRYRLKQGFTKDKALNLRLLRELKPGDFVVHIDHGVGKYSGLEKIEVNGKVQESVRIFYANKDVLYVGINSLHKISKYRASDGIAPKLHKLGSDAWTNLKRRTKKKVKDMAGELIKLYAARRKSKGTAFPPDGYLQNELESSFVFEDTPDQLTATHDVKEDMMKQSPMDRLICGDVGFGKTEIAVRAAFKAVVGGTQVAILVPTTILALQHARTFRDRLGEFGATVEYVNRFRTAKQKREIWKRLEAGEIDILIGTTAILSKDVKFKKLGLLIVDEEQKFGVGAKEKLRKLSVGVDTLTLTATPIPRTLQFSLMGARDLSILRTPPPNRQPIHTEVRVFDPEVVKEAIYYEVNRGGQVFFVHNRVKSLPDITAMIRRLCPDVDVASAHGQMDSKELEKTLIDFIDRKFEVLVCTNIIETGLDIPNANTMIINNANNFGMSDLHQLRGRIGRSNKKAFCYLFCPPLSSLTPEARKRLRTIEEFSDLGSGFNIAMKDLDIRGAGNLLGGEQSGFISDIGYETYQKILEEAINELKETDFRELFEDQIAKKKVFINDVNIDTDVEMHIPDNYVESIQERLNLYTELDNLKNEQELKKFSDGLHDRFGPIPSQVHELFHGLRLRWVARDLGFERIVLKNNKLRAYFVENPQSAYYESEIFQRIFGFIGQGGKRMGLSVKQSRNFLIMVKENVRSLKQATKVLEEVQELALGEVGV